MIPKITKNGPVLGPKLAPEIPEIGGPGLGQIFDRVFWKPLGPKKAPRWLKMAPRSPR